MELYSEEIKGLFKRNNIYTNGFKRAYCVHLLDRRLDMDSTTPIQLLLSLPDPAIKEHKRYIAIDSRSWVGIITSLVENLHKYYPKSLNEMYSFRTDWSSQMVFSSSKSLVNMRKIDENLYVNIGHTSNHLLWLVQDIIKFYFPNDFPNDIEDFNNLFALILVHRPPFAEPQNVIDVLEPYIKSKFKEYLLALNISNDNADKMLRGIDTINRLLNKSGTSYNNFYLIDSIQIYSNFKSKFLLDAEIQTNWTERQLKTARKYLDSLGSFFSFLEKQTKGRLFD